MYDLKIRKLPAYVEVKLKEEAKNHHMGLETYVRSLLEDFALHPDRITVEDRYRTLLKEITGLYQTMMKEATSCIERNTYILERLLKETEAEQERKE